MNRHYFLAIILFLWVFPVFMVSAATLSLVPEKEILKTGDEVSIDLVLNTEEIGVNAAQALIHYSFDLLEFVSADLSKSAFNFWVENPVAANGTISFLGGASPGISGKSLLLFKLKFKFLKEGKAELTLTDGVVTANDGKGTNVLAESRGTMVAFSTSALPESAPVSEEQPKPIVRTPISSAKLPSLPVLKVNLYPDPEKWYNRIGDVIVFWDLPEDVIQVASSIDKNPRLIPSDFDKELFNGKNFGSLSEGVWYLHVRYRNNIGSGPVKHYQLLIDATPPISFKIGVSEGLKIEGAVEEFKTDNPQPILFFETRDALSGLDHYAIQIGDNQEMPADANEFKLPLQPPGRRIVLIKALDKAGNVRTQALNMEILPIAPPAVTFISSEVFVGEGDFLLRGTSEPGFIVKILLKKKTGDIAAEGTATADANGNWEAVLDQPLKKGQYFVEVTAQDARGALSLPVVSDPFKVRERPLLVLGGVGITQFWFFVGIIFIFLFSFAGGGLAFSRWHARVDRKIIITQRDVQTSYGLLEKDINQALGRYADKRINEAEASEMEFLLKRMKDNLEKMKKYILEGIEEISK